MIEGEDQRSEVASSDWRDRNLVSSHTVRLRQQIGKRRVVPA